MSSAIERFKKRKAILAQPKEPVSPLSTKKKEALAKQKVDMEFVNAPGIYDKEIKSLKQGIKKINKALQK